MNEFLAETIGTAILIILGDGVVAGVLLARSKAQNAGWIVITFGWATRGGDRGVHDREHQRGAHQPGGHAGRGRHGRHSAETTRCSYCGRRVPWRLHRRGHRLAALPAALGRDRGPGPEARRLQHRAGDPQHDAQPGQRDHRHVRARLRRLRHRRPGSAPASRRSSSASWSSASASRSADRPATRSTRPATSGRASRTRCCRSPARATRTGSTLDPGGRARSSAASLVRACLYQAPRSRTG